MDSSPWRANFSSSVYQDSKAQQSTDRDATASTRSSFNTQFSEASSDLLRKSGEDVERRKRRSSTKSKETGSLGAHEKLKKRKSKKKKKSKKGGPGESSSSSMQLSQADNATTEGGQSTDEFDDNRFSSALAATFPGFESSIPGNMESRSPRPRMTRGISQYEKESSGLFSLHTYDSSRGSSSFRSGSANEKQGYKSSSSGSMPSPMSQSSMTLNSRIGASRAKYARADSGLSDITFDVNDFQSPHARNQRQGSSRKPIGIIAEERMRKRASGVTVDTYETFELPLNSPGGTITDQTIQTMSSKITSADDSIAIETHASSGDNDRSWESFVHLGRKITTRRKPDVDAALFGELKNYREDEERRRYKLEQKMKDRTENDDTSTTFKENENSARHKTARGNEGNNNGKPFGFDLNEWSDFVQEHSPIKQQGHDGLSSSTNQLEETQNSRFQSSKGPNENRQERREDESKNASFHTSRGSINSKAEKRRGRKPSSSRNDSFHSKPHKNAPNPIDATASSDLSRWEEQSMDMDDLISKRSSEGEKWEAFPKASNPRGRTSSSGSRANHMSFEGKGGTVASIPSTNGNGSINPLDVNAPSTNEDAVNAQAKKILQLYLKSMGTNEENADAIADNFIHQNIDQLAFGDSETKKNSFNASSNSKLSGEFASSSSQRRRRSGTSRTSGEERSTGSGSTSIISEAPRRSRRRPADRTWERADEPGAMQMSGRAFGAPPRSEELAARSAEEEPDIENNPATLILEAKAVDDTEDINDLQVVYADGSPLSPLHLFKERNIRRSLVVACLIIAAITAGVTVAVTRGTNSESPTGSEPDVTYPTASPSQQPTFIFDEVLEAASLISGSDAVNTLGSPQRNAVGWMSAVDQQNTTSNFGPTFNQRYALVVIFFATGGPNWDDPQSWLDPTLHECEWSSVIYCEDTQAVNALAFSANSLTGTFPAEIGALNGVNFLRLSKNKLVGSLPPELWSMPGLAVVDASENSLNGTLPTEIGLSSSLTWIDVSNNNFEGPIPDQLFQAPILGTINLSRNNIKGTIPEVLGDAMSVMKFIDFSHNQLSGELPSWGAFIPTLEVMRLRKNNFSGPLPFKTAGSWTGLKEFDVSHNSITGSVSDILPDKLEIFRIAGNKLEANLVTALCSAKSLETISLSDNKFEGPIGPLLECRDNLIFFEAHNCGLSGTLPSTLSAGLQLLDLSNNTLAGSLPFSLGGNTNLFSLKLGSNQLTGQIPASFSGLQMLKQLGLNDNNLAGTIPASLGELVALESLVLSGNPNLEGSVPLELCTVLGNASASDFGCNIECSCCFGSCASARTSNIFQ